MKRNSLVAAFSLGLTVGATLAPAVALGGGGHGGRAGGMVGGPSAGSQGRGFQSQHGGQHHGFKHHHGSHHHHFKHHSGFRPFLPSGVVTVWAPPPYVGGPAYYAPPAHYPPVQVLPAPPPTAKVIRYPHGRYELRGDGVTAPYTWVWIPTPPAPPSPPAPAAAPTPPPPPVEPPRERPPSGKGSPTPAHRVKLYLGTGSPPQSIPLYRWTDEQGVVHWTDRPDAVPLRYRTQAKSASPP
jgi:Domain of unknown function (DUF4124)